MGGRARRFEHERKGGDEGEGLHTRGKKVRAIFTGIMGRPWLVKTGIVGKES